MLYFLKKCNFKEAKYDAKEDDGNKILCASATSALKQLGAAADQVEVWWHKYKTAFDLKVWVGGGVGYCLSRWSWGSPWRCCSHLLNQSVMFKFVFWKKEKIFRNEVLEWELLEPVLNSEKSDYETYKRLFYYFAFLFPNFLDSVEEYSQLWTNLVILLILFSKQHVLVLTG